MAIDPRPCVNGAKNKHSFIGFEAPTAIFTSTYPVTGATDTANNISYDVTIVEPKSGTSSKILVLKLKSNKTHHDVPNNPSTLTWTYSTPPADKLPTVTSTAADDPNAR